MNGWIYCLLLGQAAETPGIGATQVGVVVHQERGQSRFRATVLAKGDGTLILLTAAHCLSPADIGRDAQLLRGEEAVDAKVVRLTRNPSYRPPPAADAPGADSAVATLEVSPKGEAERAVVAGMLPATAVARPYPGPDGQTVLARMLDQKGAEHAVKAGNYSNPRWLEWGPVYKPIPGDSGSGVFVLGPGVDGKPAPRLIGNVVVRAENGGGAALVSTGTGWVAEALRPVARKAQVDSAFKRD